MTGTVVNREVDVVNRPSPILSTKGRGKLRRLKRNMLLIKEVFKYQTAYFQFPFLSLSKAGEGLG